MRIEVTAEDIAKGRKGDCHNCPIAIAVRRHVGGECRVDSGYVSTSAARMTMSWPMKDFVDAFDCGGTVEPFAFDLDAAAPPPPTEEGRGRPR